LSAEVHNAILTLDAPAARLLSRGDTRLLRLEDVEALFASDVLVVDACRLAVRDADTVVPLATRPVLFTLARALAEAWPGDAPSTPTTRTACACASRSAGCARRSRRWRM
jgi:hypothetical protein